MSDNTFRGRSVPAEPQHGSGGEPLRPQPMSAEVIEAYEAGFKAGQEAAAKCCDGIADAEGIIMHEAACKAGGRDATF